MDKTIIVQINGEVFANRRGARIPDQFRNAAELAGILSSLLTSDYKILMTHGNKPQVGFDLLRSELASHMVHPLPLDVCGADTQAVTGYMLSQAFRNELKRKQNPRRVSVFVTHTLVDSSNKKEEKDFQAIGPYFDRNKATQYQNSRGWVIIEEPGLGFRRAVPSFEAVNILEIEDIRQVVNSGSVVIAGGGGGIPMTVNSHGDLEGVEAVVITETTTQCMATQLNASAIIMVLEEDLKFILCGLPTQVLTHKSLTDLDDMLKTTDAIPFKSVEVKLKAASEFLHAGGEMVLITTMSKLSDALKGSSGLWFGCGIPSKIIP